jgi:hypothetical protein
MTCFVPSPKRRRWAALLLGVSILLGAGVARVAWLASRPAVEVDQRGDVVFPVPIDRIPKVARIWIERDIRDTFGRVQSRDDVTVENLTVQRAPDDPRKREWRWNVTATLRITPYRRGPVRQRFQAVYCVDPDGQNVGALSQSLEDTDGNMSPRMLRPEWSDEFQELVKQRWALAKQDLDRGLKENPTHDPETWRKVFREECAKEFGLTDAELDEILAWQDR